jgi:hypothetical protein
MDDVTRLFRTLVKHLAEHDPRRLSAPFQISELYQSLVPYRLFKSELEFGSIEDYEMAILRLLAGERGLVTLDPDDVQEVLRAEVEAVVPDTGAFRDFAGARLVLQAEAVRSVLDERSSYAPPGFEPEPSIIPDEAQENPLSPDPGIAPELADADLEPVPPPAVDPIPPAEPVTADGRSSALVFETVEPPVSCPDCHRALPPDRTVSFCPFCGTLVTAGTCVRCGDTIEPTWRFCGTCGQPASG